MTSNPSARRKCDHRAIVLSGALPVFAEIDDSFDIDPTDIERKITPQTKVIMAVHIQGCPCDMDSIVEIAHARKTFLLRRRLLSPMHPMLNLFNGGPFVESNGLSRD